MSEVGGQRSENRGWKTGDRRQRTNDRGQISEDRCQKSGGGGQRMRNSEGGRGKYSISDCGTDNGKICVDDKIKNGYLPLKNQHSNIPPFHFSMIGASTQASNNILYIH